MTIPQLDNNLENILANNNIIKNRFNNIKEININLEIKSNTLEYLHLVMQRLNKKTTLHYKKDAYTAIFYGVELIFDEDNYITYEETYGYNGILNKPICIHNLHKLEQSELEYWQELQINETAKYVRIYGANINPFIEIFLKKVGVEIVKAKDRPKLFGLFARKEDLETIIYGYFPATHYSEDY